MLRSWGSAEPAVVPVAPREPAVRLGSTLSSAGLEHRRPPERYKRDGLARGGLPFGQIQWALAGEGWVERTGRRQALGAGRALLAILPEAITYGPSRGQEWRYLCACDHGQEALRLWREAVERAGPAVDLPPGSEPAARLQAISSAAMDGGLTDAFEVAERAHGLALAVLRHALGPGRLGAQPERRAAMERAAAFAAEHAAEPVGVVELAREAGLSRHHFSRAFSAEMGLSPGEFLRRERVARAVRLLQTTHLTLDAVAAEAGLRDASYLCRVIGRVHGQTPTQLRRAGVCPPVPRAADGAG